MADSVVELESQWLKSLEKVPKVSSITITKHLTGCGKRRLERKAINSLQKITLHNVFVREDDRGSCFVKVLCFRSQRKSEAPYAVTITSKSEDGRGIVIEAKCSCKAG